VSARVRTLGTVGVATAVAVGLAGCGGSGSSGATATTSTTGSGAAGQGTTITHSSTPHAGRPQSRPRLVRGPRLGVRQAVHTGGAYLTVTILRVLPLTDTGSPLLPGTRQVGVELRIADQHGATYDSTASGDVSLILSAGQGEPLDVRRGPCLTPDQDFESIVSSGSVRTGCVAFSVPRRARVIGVRFSPHSRGRGALTWRAG
jgi:hypothetical protein